MALVVTCSKRERITPRCNLEQFATVVDRKLEVLMPLSAILAGFTFSNRGRKGCSQGGVRPISSTEESNCELSHQFTK